MNTLPGDFRIGPLPEHSDFDVVGDRPHPGDALGRLLSGIVPPVAGDESGERHDGLYHRHTDFVRDDLRVRSECSEHVFANGIITSRLRLGWRTKLVPSLEANYPPGS